MERTIGTSLKENIATFKNLFEGDSVLRTRELVFGGGVSACLIFFDGMVNTETVNLSVVRPLVLAPDYVGDTPLARWVGEELLFANEVKYTGNISDMVSAVLYGDTLLLLEGSAVGLTLNTKGWRTRGISEPENERVLKGPREGFDEAAMFNLAMIRRKLQTPDLRCEMVRLGRRTNTLVFICYLKSLADEATLKRLRARLSAIDMDGVLDSNYIAEQIGGGGRFFKRNGSTERPDVVAAGLLEGRIALVVDGTPVVITLPYLFSENFQSDEDYYIGSRLASLNRLMRIAAFLLAVSAPAVYLALITFHFELLPTPFALTVAAARGGVPFTSFAEGVLLILTFEILRQTGVRMPQGVGHALSIVGGLVVGQAAVEARLVSAPMLIAVALSGICGLMVPRLSAPVFFLRLALVGAAVIGGLYGYLLGITLVLISVLNIRSFGVDATSSLKNPDGQSLKDTLVRVTWGRMRRRPPIQNNDLKRKR